MANTTNFNWETPDDTDLVKDGAAAIRTLGSAIDTSLVDLKGGTTGQVLAKNSNTDMDFTWVAQDDSNAIQNALLTTTGDTIYASGASTPARLAIGTTGQVLTVAGGVPSWATPAGGGGKILQVIQDTVNGEVSTTSNTFQDTGLEVTITPAASGSRILLIATCGNVGKLTGNVNNSVYLELVRGGSQIYWGADGTHFTNSDSFFYAGPISFSYIDSPATTSATTYKVRFRSYISGQTSTINKSTAGVNTLNSTLIAMEIGA
jgi:hypothetical protein